MITSLEKAFGTEVKFTRPKGGLFLWLTLPEGLSARTLLDYAVREGVTFSPGDICFVEKTQQSNQSQKERTLRLSFIQNDQSKISEGIDRLERAYRLYLSDIGESAKPQGHAEHILI